MNAIFATSSPTSCKATPNATSSSASAAGASPLEWQVSQIIRRFGLGAVLASLSPRQASSVGLLTSGTCGLRGSISSSSANLQSSLESRLRPQLGTAGSTLFVMTWKAKATPAGRAYSQLAASARRISDSDCGSWPTARATDGSKNGRTLQGVRNELARKGKLDELPSIAQLASWPTPNAIPPGRGGLQSNPEKALERKQQGHMLNLDDAVCLALWPTASARDWKSSASNQHGINARPLNEVARLASWVSPTVTDASRGVLPPRPQDTGIPLTQQVGMILNGSPAPTASRGQLNPEFSRWLMGFPEEWANCVPTVTRSSPKSRPSS